MANGIVKLNPRMTIEQTTLYGSLNIHYITGVQIDANRIACVYGINNVEPRFTADNITNLTCSILGIGDFSSAISIDHIGPDSIRFVIAHSGTIGSAYACAIGFKIVR